MHWSGTLAVTLVLCSGALSGAQEPAERSAEPIFSGPQVGEKLAPFTVRGVYDADAGKELDFVTQAGGKPIVLVFVHDANRPSIGLTRALTSYTVTRAKDGLVTGVVWLDEDATEAETMLKRIRHALTPNAPTGISLDGQEGPGSYGLNRNVTLTILVGKEDRVTANFALVQPSLQADLPKIVQAVVAVAGGPVPSLEELAGMGDMRMRAAAPREADPNLRPLIQPIIRKDATPEQVDAAAKKLQEYLRENEKAQAEVGRIAKTIVGSGKLANYGTPRAQEHLKRWAVEYGDRAPSSPAPETRNDKQPKDKTPKP